jgi:DNA modification methylase
VAAPDGIRHKENKREMKTETEYDSFIKAKTQRAGTHGFEPLPIKAPLFDWQAHIVKWAVRKGRAALFEDCGLGKTAQQLEWADQVSRKTGGSVLILTPLAVAHQTAHEAEKFGISARVAESDSDITDAGIYITNYEKLEKFNAQDFSGVVLDESSILKNFTGKMRQMLTAAFSETPYRLCCTATPSPNDYTEFGQHADFLGVCTPQQMLCTFFINDTFNTGDWRLKKHAEMEFWKWVASWAACVSKPSDIGYCDEGYILPELNIQTSIVKVDESTGAQDGELFRHATLSATTMHREMRITSPARVAKVAELVNASKEPWIVWCNTNDESEQLSRAIPDAVEVKGSDTAKQKEERLDAFTEGRSRVIVTKPGIAGYGLNWQHCSNVAFVGLSYSFEDFYQALRRSYRFGQKKQVNAWIVQASTEGAILKTVNKKIQQHKEMQEKMKIAAEAFRESEQKELTMKTTIDTAYGEGWELHHGDCVRVARQIADESIDFSIFSPPFADLFTYSNDLQDMGNCSDLEEFQGHFEVLIAEIARIMVPGREVAVHCVDLLATKWKHGYIGFQDFSGEIIRSFWKHGFVLHSRITIWKSPVTEMQRTKAHGLLHKTLTSDSAGSRVGAPDYLLVFRKPGENPKPITKDKSKYPVDWWQEVASPVWMTVDQGRVLNRDGARDNADEKHICPLQLDVIERGIELWSNPGDLVYSPFTGIGSEGYGALNLGRRFIGSELKESYFKQACQNLKNAKAQLDLFG